MSNPSATVDGARALAAVRGDAFPWIATLYFGYAFIGTHPLADVSVGDRVEGSPIDRLVVLSMFALSLGIVWSHRQEALRRLVANPLLVAVSAIIGASILWSDYPELTFRRALFYLMLTTSGLAVALSARDPKRLHFALFAAFVAVIGFNLLATAASPGVAITDIGVRGIYTQKNVAGSIAMVAFIVGAFWTAAAPKRTLGLLSLAMIFAFLLITRSKTSLALALLAPLVGGGIAFGSSGRRAALIALAGFLVALGLGFALFAAVGFDTTRALDATLGDASFTGRDELWAFAHAEIDKRPWGGHGYGAFWDVGQANDPIAKLEPGTWLGDAEIGLINQAHDGYLDLALNVGKPAACLAGVAVLFAMLRALFRAHQPGVDRQTRAAHGAFAALLFAFLIHNTTEATLFLRGAPLWSLMIVVMLAPSRANP